MMGHRVYSVALGLWVAVALLAGTAQAQEHRRQPLSVQIARARQLMRLHKNHEAVALMKDVVRQHPDDAAAVEQLALAYQADHNGFWALNVLRSFAEAHPPSCDVVAFMARVYIDQANFELAEQTLQTQNCPNSDLLRARFALLHYELAHLQRDKTAEDKWFLRAGDNDRMYDGDLATYRRLQRHRDPGRLPWLSWKLDGAIGYTTNGLAGSPQDPSVTGQDSSSSLWQLSGRARFVAPSRGLVRPVLEAQLRGLQLAAENVQGLSYWQPSLRSGVLIGRVFPRLLLSYGTDAVQIAGADKYEQGPLWYAQSHRFDYELEATDGLMAFGGGGKRWYREQGRTRWEFEQGLAAGVGLSSRLRALVGGSLRWAKAQNPAYTSRGGALLGQATYALPWRAQMRLSGTASWDAYPRSAGYFAGSRGSARTDKLVMGKLGLFSGAFVGVRLGVDGAVTHRESTAVDYSYTDMRALVHLEWAATSDAWGVQPVRAGKSPAMRYPGLPGGAGAETGGQMNDIRELMRQDESVKRGSSCLN